MGNEEKEIANLTIRSYLPSDYLAIKQNLEETGLYYDPMDSEERVKEMIRKDPESILIANVGNQVIGSAFIIETGWAAFVFRLNVKKEFQGKGVGTMLMDEVEKRVRNKGYPEVHILVDENDNELQSYYVEKGYDRGGVYRWMTKELRK